MEDYKLRMINEYKELKTKYNNKAMAERFNVSGATIEAITGGRNWKNVN